MEIRRYWSMEQKRKAKIDRCTWCLGGIFFFLYLCVVVPAIILHRDVHYYVAIDSISGLDPAKGLSFNLTLGVSSWSGAEACIKPGTSVDVSYRGVKLAASEAETGKLCAGAWKSAEQRVTARGGGVAKGQVFDGLMEDMKQGVAVFDVALHLPGGSYGPSPPYSSGREDCVSKCWGRRVGAAAALCDAPDQLPKIAV